MNTDMKEIYFTESERDNIAVGMEQELIYGKRLDSLHLNFSQTALLILDMQRFFLEPDSHAFIPSAPAIISGINQLALLFRNRHQPVIATQHSNTLENAGNMATWWRDLMLPETSMTAISEQLTCIPDLIIPKNRYDAFFDTGLNKTLRDLNIRTVIITGVMTHICCDTTARSAFQHDFNVIFPVDGNATYNRRLHMGTLHGLGHCCARITRMNRLVELFSEGWNA